MSIQSKIVFHIEDGTLFVVQDSDIDKGLVTIVNDKRTMTVSKSKLRDATDAEIAVAINGSAGVGTEECPICHSDEIEGGFIEATPGGCHQVLSCGNCHLEWKQYFKAETKRLYAC